MSDTDRVTPGDLEVIADLADAGDRAVTAHQFRRAAATIRALSAERDKLERDAECANSVAETNINTITKAWAELDALRPIVADAQAIAAAKAAIEAWGGMWEERQAVAHRSPLQACAMGRSYLFAGTPGEAATADDWRDLAGQVIEQEAASYRERVEAAGYRLVLYCGDAGAYPDCPPEYPVQVMWPPGESFHQRHPATFGDRGGYPTRDDCEEAAQWAEAQAAGQEEANPCSTQTS